MLYYIILNFKFYDILEKIILMTYEIYLQKLSLLKKMSYHYYVLDNPIASDYEYDMLYKDILEFEKSNPSLIAQDSPTRKVGDEILAGFSKAKHIERMWSLEDVFNYNELCEWVERIYKNIGEARFMCDAKFDGASLNLLYENGILQSAITRGDGNIGEQVLQNAKTIQSIPLQIPYQDKIEIRGEIVINKDDFEALNNERILNGDSIFANPRNAASGSMRNLDPNVTKSRKLQFIPWGFGYAKMQDNSFFNRINEIKKFGFIDSKLCRICTNVDEIEEFYRHIISIRQTYPIMLDGMVVRLDSIRAQEALGYTIKNPRFAVAYKFPAIEKQTKLLDIELQVGRSGVVTPVAILQKIDIEGAMISRATLHNFDEINKKDIRINDVVLIIRSGDVIPKIIKSIPELRDGTQMIIQKPTHCPVCGSELLLEDILIKCHNLHCEARVKNAIIHFCSKKAMNIIGMGKKIVEFLFDEKIIYDIKDIFAIKYEDLANYEGWQAKKIQNLLDSIDSVKRAPLWRFINALGIEHIGEGASKKLASIFGFEIFNVSVDELLRINGVGEEMAKSVSSFMQTNKDEIQILRDIINPSIENEVNTNTLFANEIIVLTGSMSKPRDSIVELLESFGASVGSSVSKKTTMLIYGENAGSKLQKAKEFGIKMISESELYKMIN